MKFWASIAAKAHTEARGEPLEAIANWTCIRRRYREPTPQEAALWPCGATAKVVRDEGLLFIRHGDSIAAYTLEELGCP